MQKAQYVRLYSDDEGESHFEDIEVTLDPVDFAPLPGGGGTAKCMRFEDEADCTAKTPELPSVIRAWREMKRSKDARRKPD